MLKINNKHIFRLINVLMANCCDFMFNCRFTEKDTKNVTESYTCLPYITILDVMVTFH